MSFSFILTKIRTQGIYSCSPYSNDSFLRLLFEKGVDKPLAATDAWSSASPFGSSFCFRDCIPRVPVCSLLWALQCRAALLKGRPLRLQDGLAQCRRIMDLLSPLDIATLAGLEQLWARGTWNHMLCPVAPAFTRQHLVCSVSFHLLSVAALSAHGLLLWPNRGCNQEGEFTDC